MIFNQLANPVDNSKVMELKRETIEANVPSLFRRMPLERMMQIVINNLNFINLETIERKKTLRYLEKLEGFPVCGTRDFYSNGLKPPQFYQKHGITDMPYIYNKRKIGNKIIKTKVTYDPKYVISMTAYVELSGHHRLSFYGIVKRVKSDGDTITLEILPLAIGLRQPIDPISTHFRLFY
jgi:hypothetical protein